MNLETALAAAREAGFAHLGPLDPAAIELKPEVRQMCLPCRMYGKRWSCPPGCGSLQDCREKLAGVSFGILVQTVGRLEDPWDGTAMLEAEALHKQRFQALYGHFRQLGFPVLALGAGCCLQCSDCTYPGSPCRFPEKMVCSMESFGMEVAAVCRANGLPYYYGENTIAYTGCFLFRPGSSPGA